MLEYPELGMEAIWRIEVENFPAFIVVDDKGNDFFKVHTPTHHSPSHGRAVWRSRSHDMRSADRWSTGLGDCRPLQMQPSAGSAAWC